MTKPRIMVTVLTTLERGGWPNPHLLPALVHWSTDPRWELVYQMSHGFWTSQEARNHACREFLSSDCDYLLMIDNDTKPFIGSDPVHLPEMALYGLPIVGAPVPVLHHGTTWYPNVYRMETEQGPDGYPRYRSYPLDVFPEALLHGPLFQCDAVGSGALCIRRDVIQQMSSVWEDPGHGTVFSRPRWPDGSTRIGEDMWFCHRASRLMADGKRGTQRFPIHASLPHFCGHLHTVDYADIPTMKVATASPTGRVAEEGGEPRRDWYAFTDYADAIPGLAVPDSLLTPFAITPSQARFLLSTLESQSPRSYLEFGCGISTMVAHRWSLFGRNGLPRPTIHTIEGKIEHFGQLERYLGLGGEVCNHVLCNGLPLRHDHLTLGTRGQSPRLIFVDGATTLSNYPESQDRHSIVETLYRYGSSGDTLILDDCQRPYERSIILQLQEHLSCWSNPWFVPFPDGKQFGIWRVEGERAERPERDFEYTSTSGGAGDLTAQPGRDT